jgi:hypothetical protein
MCFIPPPNLEVNPNFRVLPIYYPDLADFDEIFHAVLGWTVR